MRKCEFGSFSLLESDFYSDNSFVITLAAKKEKNLYFIRTFLIQ